MFGMLTVLLWVIGGLFVLSVVAWLFIYGLAGISRLFATNPERERRNLMRDAEKGLAEAAARFWVKFPDGSPHIEALERSNPELARKLLEHRPRLTA